MPHCWTAPVTENGLADAVALVTGAGGGLGGAIAAGLSRAGAKVALHCRDSVEAAEEIKRILAQEGRPSRVYRGDLAHETDVRLLFESVLSDWDGIDVLVNNAGSALVKPALETSADEWERVLRNNLTSAFLCSKAGAQAMAERGAGGSIISIASIAGLYGLRNRVAYCAAKAGIVGMTRALAIEWADHRIRVNAVAPGVVATEAVRAALEDGRVSAQDAIHRTPLGRLSAPEEVADVVRFLASDEASYITGQCLSVDGGWSASAGDALEQRRDAVGPEASSGSQDEAHG
jgi:NAD(P)-dependent dehydrogenase (short-subunit alcohol dehydrogenase family)